MVQKAKKIPTATDRLRKNIHGVRELYGLNRINRTPASIGNAPLGNLGGSAGGVQVSQGNFLKTSGDTMVGPIAFFPATVSINGSDELDISVGATSNPQSSSYVIASFSSPDKIQLIKGAQFSGQKLWLQVPGLSTLTLEDYSNNAGGNVVTGDGTDLVITTTTDPVVIELQFDVTLGPNGNNGGWSVLYAKSVTGGSATVSFPVKYPVDDQSTQTGNVVHDLDANNAHKLQFTATGDCDITLDNIPSGGANAIDFFIEVTQDSTGGHAITFNNSEVINPPTISTTADTTSLLSCHADGDGNVRIITLLNAQPTSGNFATKALDNLVSPVLNTDINVNNNDFTNIDRAMFVSNTGTSATDANIAVNSADTKLVFNVPSGYEWAFTENNIQKWTMSPTTLTGANVVVSDTLAISNSSTDPVSDGIFTVNGTDVKVHTGGVVKNLSDIGSGGGTPFQIVQGDSEVTVTDVGAGNIVGKVDNIQQFSVTASAFSIDNDVNLGALSTDTITFNGQADSDLRMEGNAVVFDADEDTKIQAGTDDVMQFTTGASARMSLSNSSLALTVPFSTNLTPTSTSILVGESTNRFGTFWGSAVDITGSLNVAGNATLGGDVSLGNSSTDDINFSGTANSDLDMGEFDIDKISSALFYDGLGNLVGQIRGVNASSDILEVRLEGGTDFSITDAGSAVMSLNNTLSIWSMQGASELDFPKLLRLVENSDTISTPPTGTAYLYLDNNSGTQELRIKFDNGNDKLILNET